MGMAASQARLLSITSRMADNELRAQIANNAKMRLASDSSRISADYVNALNNATMMITNYNEAGDSQFNKLTFNRLTQYSPFNTQYGLSNTYGQLLVNENEAKIFEAAGGDLKTYLKAHDLEYGTSYFDKESWDGKTQITFENGEGLTDEYGKDLGNFSLEDLKTMYLGGTDSNGLAHLGFEANEDIYQSFLNKVSNFSSAYNRCQADSEITKLVEEDIQDAFSRKDNGKSINDGANQDGFDYYEYYRQVAAGNADKDDLDKKTPKQLKRLFQKIINDIYNLSYDGEKGLYDTSDDELAETPKSESPDTYVSGATPSYWKEVVAKYCTVDENGIPELDDNYEFKIKDLEGTDGTKSLGYINTGITYNVIQDGAENVNNYLYYLSNADSSATDVNENFVNGGTVLALFNSLEGKGNNKTINPEWVSLDSDGMWTVKTDGETTYRLPEFMMASNSDNTDYQLLSWGIDFTKVSDHATKEEAFNNTYFIKMFDSDLDAYKKDASNQIPPGVLALVKCADGKYKLVIGQNSTDDSIYASGGGTYADNMEYAGGYQNKKDLMVEWAEYDDGFCGLGTEHDNVLIYDLSNSNAFDNGYLKWGGDTQTDNTTFKLCTAISDENGNYSYEYVNCKFKFDKDKKELFIEYDDGSIMGYKLSNDNKLEEQAYYTEKEIYKNLCKELCRDAFGAPENGENPATSGNFIYSVNLLEYIENAAQKGNTNANEAWTLKENIKNVYGVDLATLNTIDFSYVGSYKDQLLSDAGKTEDEKKYCHAIYDNYILNNLFDIYGEPNITWIDSKNADSDAEAKVKWYTNMFERMSKGYAVLEDGLARSNEWMEFALESGIVTIEQVDKSNNWNGTPYSNVASITEVTDDVAVAKAEADYKKAMNEVENKDKRLDIELKNIDTEHNALQTEYDSVKKVIDKNVERSFKMYNA